MVISRYWQRTVLVVSKGRSIGRCPSDQPDITLPRRKHKPLYGTQGPMPGHGSLLLHEIMIHGSFVKR